MLLLFIAVGCFLPIARADDHHEGGHREGQHRADLHHFSGRNYHHWHERERAIWRRGVWHHKAYMGRLGWWWTVGGMCYFFERPVYPYPLVVPEIAYELPVVVQPPPPVYTQQPPADPNYWYYCENPKGYYPYVQNCPGGWMKVVPQPTTPGR
jgi:hypothetical protein